MEEEEEKEEEDEEEEEEDKSMGGKEKWSDGMKEEPMRGRR